MLMRNSVKAPHEIEMPCRTAEFAVRNDMISKFLLFCDKVKDARILRLLQRRLVNLPLLIIESGLFQLGRS